MINRGNRIYNVSLFIIYDWITMIMGHSKRELRTKKHVVLLKKNCHRTPLLQPLLQNDRFLLSPRRPLWRGWTLNNAIVFGPFFPFYLNQKKKKRNLTFFSSFENCSCDSHRSI